MCPSFLVKLCVLLLHSNKFAFCVKPTSFRDLLVSKRYDALVLQFSFPLFFCSVLFGERKVLIQMNNLVDLIAFKIRIYVTVRGNHIIKI